MMRVLSAVQLSTGIVCLAAAIVGCGLGGDGACPTGHLQYHYGDNVADQTEFVCCSGGGCVN